MDHLLCFTGGMLVLGAVDADEELATEYLNLAKGVSSSALLGVVMATEPSL